MRSTKLDRGAVTFRRSAVITGMALVLGGAVVVPSASAAAPAGPQACATKTLTTGYHKQGTTVNKSGSSSCNDLNLTYSNDSTSTVGDSYRGFYKTSSGWKGGSRGYIFAYDVNHSPWIVLLSDVSAGTPMGVGSWYDGGDTVKVAH
ncbi:hypothetical protein [Streptomyces sp. KL118A]|uniref:hypothetical protein n=1 Tax=Streptomyces sp. KL118A TaxID=3045153 RepID=UPI00278BDE46|nr:hypothetical protein [Streptomyces sp. KL118A]